MYCVVSLSFYTQVIYIYIHTCITAYFSTENGCAQKNSMQLCKVIVLIADHWLLATFRHVEMQNG